MAGKATYFSNALLELVLNNAATMLGLGDAAGPLGSVANGFGYLGLHTGDPGIGGSQTTSEVSYGSYSRVPIARDPGSKKWAVASQQAANTVVVSWPTASSGSVVASWLSYGTDSTGAGNVIYRGVLNQPITITPGFPPQAQVGDLVIAEI